jgi:hypothetical protein
MGKKREEKNPFFTQGELFAAGDRRSPLVYDRGQIRFAICPGCALQTVELPCSLHVVRIYPVVTVA